MMKTCLLMITTFFLLNPVSFASDACKPDIQKFCKGIEGGEGGMMTCLLRHRSELSAACQKAQAELRESLKKRRIEVKVSCAADSEKFCKGMFDPHKKIECLKEHEEKLSTACKAVLPNR
jgi:hypothetical protein